MWSKERYHLMGTFIDIQIDHEDGPALLKQCYEQLLVFNQRFSANDNASELMQINQQAGLKPVKVHQQLYDLIAYGKSASLVDNQFLNIALGPIVKLWGIGFKNAVKPTAAEITKALQKTNPRAIHLLPENTVYLPIEGMEIDLGALAKGYFADLLKIFLVNQGVQNGLINLGGNVLVWGAAKQRDHWRIGIQKPFYQKGEYAVVAAIKDCSIVTSGIYERTFIAENQRYHHIFDPKTGYPINTDVASLTVVCKKSLAAEKWTTQLFGFSSDEIITMANHQPGIEVFVITTQQVSKYSDGFPMI